MKTYKKCCNVLRWIIALSTWSICMWMIPFGTFYESTASWMAILCTCGVVSTERMVPTQYLKQRITSIAQHPISLIFFTLCVVSTLILAALLSIETMAYEAGVFLILTAGISFFRYPVSVEDVLRINMRLIKSMWRISIVCMEAIGVWTRSVVLR